MRLSILVLFAFSLFSANIKAPLDRVTVYPSSAKVTRQARIDVPAAGEHSFTIEGIPISADPASIRLKGSSTSDMIFGGIDMKPIYTEPDTGRMAEIRERLKVIDDEIAALSQKRSALDIQRQYLSNIGVIAAQGGTEQLRQANVDPVSYEKTLDFLDRGLMSIADRTVQFGIDERGLREEKTRLERELSALGGRKTRGYDATFTVKANQAGKADIEVSYIVSGAQWTPSYDLRFEVEEGIIDVTYYGIVRQNTGEKWSNVKVTLSTSSPQRGAAAPELSPWYLDVFEGYYGKGQAAPAPMLSRAKEAVVIFDEEAEMDDFAAMPNEIWTETADVTGSGTVEFVIPGRATVDEDFSTKKLTVSTFDLEAEESYITVPKLSTFAYLNAKFTNTTDFPMLSGEAGIFQGQTYMGKRSIPYISTGEELDLSMGIVEAIKVERKRIEDFREKAGLFGGKRRLNFGWETEITNNLPREIEIQVKDQIPVPRDERIDIKDIETVPEKESNRQGMIDWKFKLQKGEKKTAKLIFTVEYPDDVDVSGI